MKNRCHNIAWRSDREAEVLFVSLRYYFWKNRGLLVYENDAWSSWLSWLGGLVINTSPFPTLSPFFPYGFLFLSPFLSPFLLSFLLHFLFHFLSPVFCPFFSLSSPFLSPLFPLVQINSSYINGIEATAEHGSGTSRQQPVVGEGKRTRRP